MIFYDDDDGIRNDDDDDNSCTGTTAPTAEEGSRTITQQQVGLLLDVAVIITDMIFVTTGATSGCVKFLKTA